MYRGATIAVVVPAHREERILPRMLARVPDFVDQIIVVDDGSPDATAEVARRAADLDPRITVLVLAQNQGVGRAITRGYEQALEQRADVVAVMAGDDQMDPADLPALLDPVVEGRADYAKGNRLAHTDWRRMPFVRRQGTRALATLTGVLAGYPSLRDSQCGYTAISAQALRQLPLDELYPRYGYPNDLLMRLGASRARLAQPAVRPVYADEVSGLRVSRVALPIGGILARGLLRRLRRAAPIAQKR